MLDGFGRIFHLSRNFEKVRVSSRVSFYKYFFSGPDKLFFVLKKVSETIFQIYSENVLDDRLRFGTKEISPFQFDDEEIYEEEAPKHQINIHQECALPTSHADLIDQGKIKFQRLLTVQEKRSHRLRSNLTNRLLQRYQNLKKLHSTVLGHTLINAKYLLRSPL